MMRSLICCLVVSIVLGQPALAQNVRDERLQPIQDEVVNLNQLPAGRLQEVDWNTTELVIDGKRYRFNDDVLRVYANEGEITLLDLSPNAVIRYQTAGRKNGDLIVRIWAADASSFCLLYTSPSPRDPSISRMPSSA